MDANTMRALITVRVRLRQCMDLIEGVKVICEVRGWSISNENQALQAILLALDQHEDEARSDGDA